MSESGALLTPTQREYLRGKSEKEGASERMTQKRIRERISQTLVEDIQLLQRSIESDMVSLEYEDLINDIPRGARRKSFSRAIVFICQLAVVDDIDVDDLLEEVQAEVEEGRKKAIREKLRKDSKSVTIGELLEIMSPEELLGEIDEGIDPGPSEIGELIKDEETSDQ
jgi:hypothetical protein